MKRKPIRLTKKQKLLAKEIRMDLSRIYFTEIMSDAAKIYAWVCIAIAIKKYVNEKHGNSL